MTSSAVNRPRAVAVEAVTLQRDPRVVGISLIDRRDLVQRMSGMQREHALRVRVKRPRPRLRHLLEGRELAGGLELGGLLLVAEVPGVEPPPPWGSAIGSVNDSGRLQSERETSGHGILMY